MIIPVVLCGGQGTRLWPISRDNLPKQFFSLYNSKSLLQNSILRIANTLQEEAPLYILTNQNQRFLVEQQLKEISVKSADIFLEPSRKGTCPAITLAAIDAYRKNPDSVLLVISSDNDIIETERFSNMIGNAGKLSYRNNLFLLFSSKALYPETGYGYMKANELLDKIGRQQIFNIKRFVEKPSLLEAKALIKDKYQWNTGISILPTKLYIEELKKYGPQIYETCLKSFEKGTSIKDRDTDYNVRYFDKESFETLDETTLEYVVMEKTANACVMQTNIGWSDVGSWSSIYKIRNKDSDGNILDGENVVSINSKNTFILSRSNKHLVATINVKNITIVDTEDATLILDTNSSQDVRKVISDLKFDEKYQYLSSSFVTHRWGKSEKIMHELNLIVKKFILEPGKKYRSKGSKMHKQIIMQSGSITVKYLDKVIKLAKGKSCIVPSSIPYSIYNPANDLDSIFIKIESFHQN